MALSGTLQNFAGGVMILIFRPYRVGDFIEAQGFGGTVREIQIFSTILTTPDNQTIIIPNGGLSTGTIKNSTKASRRRVDIDVEVAYGTQPEAVRNVLTTLCEAEPRIMQGEDNPIAMPMTAMSASSIVFNLRIWVKAEDYWPVRFDMTERIYTSLTAAGIEIPFQQIDVHMK
jgi:small conductance mechanosensitive channel